MKTCATKVGLILFFITVLNCFSQITLQNYYKNFSRYHLSQSSMLKDIKRLDSLFGTGIAEDSLLLSRLIRHHNWRDGYLNFYSQYVSSEQLIRDGGKYENVKEIFDQEIKYKKRSGLFALIGLPGVVWLGITVIAFPVAALGSGDTDWIRSLAWMIPGITLCSVTIPAEVMCYYYLLKAQFIVKRLPHEYNGAVIVNFSKPQGIIKE